MRDSNYGFKAIELRGQLLCPDDVYSLSNHRKVDLSRMFIKLYGHKYMKHPQLKSLIEYNYKLPLNFLEGKDEAEAFENGEYVKLHQSTGAKVNSMSKLVEMAINGELKTHAKWKDMYGWSIDGIAALIKTKWYLRLIWWVFMVGAAAVLGAVLVDSLLQLETVEAPHVILQIF